MIEAKQNLVAKIGWKLLETVVSSQQIVNNNRQLGISGFQSNFVCWHIA